MGDESFFPVQDSLLPNLFFLRALAPSQPGLPWEDSRLPQLSSRQRIRSFPACPPCRGLAPS
jgi:hypothetical protein